MLPLLLATMLAPEPQWVEYVGTKGPGLGKHIVLISGDEEYRSEEMLPQLAKILAERHGFRCTVLFSLNQQGEIDPNVQTNQPGTHLLAKADLCVIMLRFRRWPDAQMQPFVDYMDSGKPLMAIRTSTHAFDFPADSKFASFGWRHPDGFAKKVVGETWVSHWGDHGTQATRGVITAASHPVVRGIESMFGPTDVYEAHPPASADVLIRGEVVQGMKPSDPPATGQKKTARGNEQDLNDPMMPIVWTLRAPKGNRVLTSTMGAATDFTDEGFRQLMVNGTFWLVGLDVPPKASVDLVGRYEPTAFGFNTFRKGIRPKDHLD